MRSKCAPFAAQKLQVGCSIGDLRLTKTSNRILQICKSKEWRVVSSQDWGHLDDAAVLQTTWILPYVF